MFNYVKNYTDDAKCLKKHVVYQTSASQETSGLWTYTLNTPNKWGTFRRSPDSVKSMINKIPLGFYAKFTLNDSASGVGCYRGGTYIERDKTHVIFQVKSEQPNEVNPTLLLEGKGNTASCTLEKYAVYTLDDWNRIKALYDSGILEIPWFNYDTMPISIN